MEEYIQILIFVGAMIIMVVQQSIKEKKKPKTSPFPEGEILDEVFPNLIGFGKEKEKTSESYQTYRNGSNRISAFFNKRQDSNK